MKNQLTFRLVFSGLLAAVVCVMTMISIPLSATGYANLGDCFVILSGVVLGPVYGPLAAGVGSMLADLFLGYTVYAPATFVIKGLMSLAVALIIGKKTQLSGVTAVLKTALAAILAEVIMLAGYFSYESVLYGVKTALAAALGNTLQGVVGAVSATIVCTVLSASGVMSKIKSMLGKQ